MRFSHTHIPIILHDAGFPSDVEVGLVKNPEVEICCQLIYLDAIGLLWDLAFSNDCFEYEYVCNLVKKMAASVHAVLQAKHIPDKFKPFVKTILVDRERPVVVVSYSGKLDQYYNKNIKEFNKEDIVRLQLSPAALFKYFVYGIHVSLL